MKSNPKSDIVDKIDLEELIKEFKVLSLDTFYVYLKEVWKVMMNLNFLGSRPKIR